MYVCGKSNFEDDGTLNYLAFQPIRRYFKWIDGVGNGKFIIGNLKDCLMK